MMMMMMMMILRVLRMRVRGTTSPKWSRVVGVVDPCTGGGGPYSDNAALIYGRRRRRLALALLSNGDAAAHRGCAGRKTGRLKTQVRKNESTGGWNMQVRNT